VVEAIFAALLDRLADSAAPLEEISVWVDSRPDLFRHDGGASFHLRANVQSALAVCWRHQLGEISEAAARARLAAIARRTVAPPPPTWPASAPPLGAPRRTIPPPADRPVWPPRARRRA